MRINKQDGDAFTPGKLSIIDGVPVKESTNKHMSINKHIKTIQRRLDYLNRLLIGHEDRTDFSYVIAERNAIKFALKCITKATTPKTKGA